MRGPPLTHAFGALLVGAVLVLGATGCGGGGSKRNQSGTTTVATTTTSAPDRAADKRVARGSQLKLADFPSGWVQQGSAQRSGPASKCPGVEAVKAETSARSTSPTFVRGAGPQVNASVYIFSDAANATQAFARLSGESTRRCLAHTIGKAAASANQQGVQLGKVTTGELSMPPVGSESAVGRFTVPVMTNGANVSTFLDVVFVRVGRGIAIVNYADVSTPFGEALRNRLTRTLAGRLRAGLLSAH